MTADHRRTTVAVAVIAVMVVTSLAAELFQATDGSPLWWVPTAVLVTYLQSDRLSVTLPVAATAQLVAGIVVTGNTAADLPVVVISSVTVPMAYAAALVLMDVLRTRWSGTVARSTTFLAALVVVGPVTAAVVTQGVVLALGLRTAEAATTAAVTMAVADAAAIIGLVPLLRMVTTRGWRLDCDPRSARVTAALGAASLAAGFTSVAWWVDGRSMLFVGALPLLLATTSRQGWVVRMVLATTGTGVAAGLAFADGTTVSAVDAQAAFVGAAAIAIAITALARARTGETPRPDRLVLAGVAVAGRAEVLGRVAATVRHVRLGLIVVLGMDVLISYRGGWTADPLPLWAAALGAPALLLLANALSVHMDASLGQSQRRQRLESALDVTVALTLYTLFAPLSGMQPLPVGVFLVLAAVSLRLRPAEAFAAGVGLVVGLTAFRTLDPLPWSVVTPTFQPASVLPLATTALLVVWLISWTSQLLHASREQVTTLAGRLDLTNASMAVATAQREAAFEALAQRTTELEAATEEAREAAVHERAARDDYERFAALVAHDLASPMATIQGIARLLTRADLDEETRAQLLGSAANSASRAAALVDRLHDHARAGTTTLRPARLPLAEVVADVVTDLEAGIRATGSVVTWADDLPTVVADRVLLGQLLGNLLGNALRHGADDDGVARITIGASRTSVATTVITVTDEGPGIDPVVADDLFIVGVRGTRSRGLGLGMATCRTIVERHGGALEIGVGPDGRGTIVTVTLPATIDVAVVDGGGVGGTTSPDALSGGMRFDALPEAPSVVGVTGAGRD